jgi:hypothetical protein
MPRIKSDEIIARLKSIEDKVDDLSFSTVKQWLAAVGIGIVIAAIPMLFQNAELAAIMWAVGFIMAILARFLRRQHGKL